MAGGSMDWLGYVVSLGVGGGVWQGLRVFVDWRRGINADERDARAAAQQQKVDATTGYVSFTDDLREAMAAERARLDKIQARLDEVDRRRQVAYDYADELRRHINDRLPPPPPPWPEGI